MMFMTSMFPQLVANRACIVSIYAGPTKANPGDRVIKFADGSAVGRKLRLVVSPQPLKQHLMLSEDATQGVCQAPVIDLIEAHLEVLVADHLHGFQESATIG